MKTSAAAAVATTALALSACGASSGAGGSTTLTVFAAASLTDSFEDLADRFSEVRDDVDVQLSFAGSSDLVAQIREGAPADVIATADERTMQSLVDDGRVAAEPRAFVSNTLVIAVPAGNPQDIDSLEALADPHLDVVLCAPQVPCGSAARLVGESADVTIAPVSEEPAVTDVLGKVANGQADAGLVYRTDAAGAERIDAVEFPESDEAVNHYPIAPVADAENAEAGQEFLDYVLSDEGRAVFDAAGFGAP